MQSLALNINIKLDFVTFWARLSRLFTLGRSSHKVELEDYLKQEGVKTSACFK